MTKAMPFLQKVILLSYDPRPLQAGYFCVKKRHTKMVCLFCPFGLYVFNYSSTLYQNGRRKCR